MNFYALNETALNGWATLFSGGSSALQLDGAGEAALANVAPPGAANLELELIGSSATAVLATAAAYLELTAQHGIPNPMPEPAQHVAPHPRARLHAPRHADPLVVPAEQPTRAQSAPRLARVPRERKV